jgi:hypothetical protein
MGFQKFLLIKAAAAKFERQVSRGASGHESILAAELTLRLLTFDGSPSRILEDDMLRHEAAAEWLSPFRTVSPFPYLKFSSNACFDIP